MFWCENNISDRILIMLILIQVRIRKTFYKKNRKTIFYIRRKRFLHFWQTCFQWLNRFKISNVVIKSFQTKLSIAISSGIPTKSKVDPEISRLGRKAFKSMVDIPIGWADGSNVGSDGGTIGGENQG